MALVAEPVLSLRSRVVSLSVILSVSLSNLSVILSVNLSVLDPPIVCLSLELSVKRCNDQYDLLFWYPRFSTFCFRAGTKAATQRSIYAPLPLALVWCTEALVHSFLRRPNNFCSPPLLEPPVGLLSLPIFLEEKHL